jgi:HEPN domain-containing protein
MADTTPKIIETNPKALLNFARQYFMAAEAAFEKNPSLWQPLNYLYFHTVELLLKAFLRANGKEPERGQRGHEIEELLREAAAVGLVEPAGIQSIVSLLTTGNTDHAFRYGTSKSTTEADLSWTREVVGRLLEVVGAFVDPDDTLKTVGPAVAFRMMVFKPIRKSVPE